MGKNDEYLRHSGFNVDSYDSRMETDDILTSYKNDVLEKLNRMSSKEGLSEPTKKLFTRSISLINYFNENELEAILTRRGKELKAALEKGCEKAEARKAEKQKKKVEKTSDDTFELRKNVLKKAETSIKMIENSSENAKVVPKEVIPYKNIVKYIKEFSEEDLKKLDAAKNSEEVKDIILGIARTNPKIKFTYNPDNKKAVEAKDEVASNNLKTETILKKLEEKFTKGLNEVDAELVKDGLQKDKRTNIELLNFKEALNDFKAEYYPKVPGVEIFPGRNITNEALVVLEKFFSGNSKLFSKHASQKYISWINSTESDFKEIFGNARKIRGQFIGDKEGIKLYHLIDKTLETMPISIRSAQEILDTSKDEITNLVDYSKRISDENKNKIERFESIWKNLVDFTKFCKGVNDNGGVESGKLTEAEFNRKKQALETVLNKILSNFDTKISSGNMEESILDMTFKDFLISEGYDDSYYRSYFFRNVAGNKEKLDNWRKLNRSLKKELEDAEEVQTHLKALRKEYFDAKDDYEMAIATKKDKKTIDSLKAKMDKAKEIVDTETKKSEVAPKLPPKDKNKEDGRVEKYLDDVLELRNYVHNLKWTDLDFEHPYDDGIDRKKWAISEKAYNKKIVDKLMIYVKMFKSTTSKTVGLNGAVNEKEVTVAKSDVPELADQIEAYEKDTHEEFVFGDEESENDFAKYCAKKWGFKHPYTKKYIEFYEKLSGKKYRPGVKESEKDFEEFCEKRFNFKVPDLNERVEIYEKESGKEYIPSDEASKKAFKEFCIKKWGIEKPVAERFSSKGTTIGLHNAANAEELKRVKNDNEVTRYAYKSNKDTAVLNGYKEYDSVGKKLDRFAMFDMAVKKCFDEGKKIYYLGARLGVVNKDMFVIIPNGVIENKPTPDTKFGNVYRIPNNAGKQVSTNVIAANDKFIKPNEKTEKYKCVIIATKNNKEAYNLTSEEFEKFAKKKESSIVTESKFFDY